MVILVSLLVFSLFIIFLNFFSTRYIQFIYKKMYVDHKKALDTITMFGSVPQSWSKYGKQGCLRRLKKLKKFVSMDRGTSQQEKDDLLEILCDMENEWKKSLR